METIGPAGAPQDQGKTDLQRHKEQLPALLLALRITYDGIFLTRGVDDLSSVIPRWQGPGC